MPPWRKIFSSSRQDAESGALELYRYESLVNDDEYIRVLDLHQTRGENLECTIRQIPVSNGGYHALSYEWGDSETPHRILVRNDEKKLIGYIPLTKNLGNALKDLRDAPKLESKEGQDSWFHKKGAYNFADGKKNHEANSVHDALRDVKEMQKPATSKSSGSKLIRRFWIDQICINQKDLKEKGRQVKLMAKIYQNALQVITYLGPGLDDSAERHVFTLITIFFYHFKPNYRIFANVGELWTLWKDRENLPITNIPEFIASINPNWVSLIKFVFGGWMRRLWMLQENILCPRITMLRGWRALNWYAVAAIPILFHLKYLPYDLLQETWPELGFTSDSSSVTQLVVQMWEARMAHDSGDGRINSLARNLVLFEKLNCFDPKDRVYALLGISKDTDQLGIVPDYEKPERQVFSEATMAVYKNDTTSLGLLESLSGLDPSLDLSVPSWSFRPGKTVVLSFHFPHRPHPSPVAEMRFEPEASTMVMRGRIVDTIEYVAPRIPFWTREMVLPLEDAEVAGHLRQTIYALVAMLEYLGVELSTMAGMFRALTEYPKRLRSQEMDDVFSLGLQQFTKLLMDQLGTYYTGGREVVEHQTYVERTGGVLEAMNGMLEGIKDDDVSDPDGQWFDGCDGEPVMLGHSFCVTKHKRISNAAGSVQKGDVVAAFPVGSLLFILRPVNDRPDTYQYIGTAYVDGLMHGEAYDGISFAEVDEEIRLI